MWFFGLIRWISPTDTFLLPTETYHMIDKCDTDIATWSETGDNFVVKNVEQFAHSVLPMYFKHNNFSSFARQLNFYGAFVIFWAIDVPIS